MTHPHVQATPHRPTYDGGMSAHPVRSAVLYSVLRLLAFAVPFGLMMLLPIFQQFVWLAAIFAALIGLSISVIFLRRPLDEVTTTLADNRERRRAARSGDRVRRNEFDEDEAADAYFGDDDAR
jgi:hypothetical protein